MDAIQGLYDVICDRQKNPFEGSYTCYLFEKGLDKILKKVAEECGETIIAAKNGDNEELCEELADLCYHALVLMAETGLPLERLEEVLETRRQKIGNLKTVRDTDRQS